MDVEYYHGACDTLRGARVDATPQAVRITIQMEEDTGPCADMGLTSYARVRLGAKLENRTIVGSCDATTNRLCNYNSAGRTPKHPPLVGP